jgi:hypothetical protein
MAPVRRIVLDVLKPHDPPMLEFTRRLTGLDSVEGITTSLVELDREVQNVTLTIEGAALDVPAIEERIEGLGGAVHSVDQVACGEYIVDDSETPQDG